MKSFQIWTEEIAAQSFARDLRNFLQQEQVFLKNDREKYLEWLNNQSLEDRVKSDNLNMQGPDEEIYAIGNQPKSPVRNGMILYGMYLQYGLKTKDSEY